MIKTTNVSNGGESLERLTMQEALPLTASRETIKTREEDEAVPVVSSAQKLKQYHQFISAYSTEDLQKLGGLTRSQRH